MAAPALSPPRPRLRLSFSTLLALLLLALTALPVTIVLVAAFGSGIRNTQALLADKGRLAVDSMVQRTRQYLEPAQTAALFIHHLFERGELDPDDPAAIEAVIRYAFIAGSQLNGLAVVHRDGWSVVAYRDSAAGATTERGNWQDDPVIRREIESGQGRGSPYWGTPIFIEAAGTTMVSYVVPLRRDGEFLGAVASTIRLETLSSFITELGGQMNDTSFILFGRDQVIAHRAMTGGAAPVSTRDPLPALDELGDPVLAAIWQQTGDRPETSPWAEIPGGGYGRRLEVGGAEYAVLYQQLDLPTLTEPWLVGAYVPGAQVFAEIKRLALAGAFSAAALALTLVAALLVGRSLRQPVDELARLANAVSRLEVEGVETHVRSRIIELDNAIDALGRAGTALRLFARFVPRRVVEVALEDGEAEVMRPRARVATVMFTDMVGFSRIAGEMEAQTCASFLNGHLSLLTGCIEAEGGVVDKFIGDAVMAVWTPAEQAAGAEAAARAALAIREAVHRDNAGRKVPVRVRIGLHTGPVIVGSIGAPSRLNFTIVGDAVNIAQRIEALGKSLAPDAEVAVLLSGDTAALLPAGWQVRALGPQVLAGRDAKMPIFTLDRPAC